MRISPLVLLLGAIVGCGSGTPDTATVKKQMTPAQLALGDPVINSVGMMLLPIPAGEFQMGSPDSDRDADPDEKPQHLVKITKPFYLGVYEVTQGQYEKVMGSRPWQGYQYVKEASDYPAVHVIHDDAVEFCRKLSKREGVEYRLPTEAEWEYACRAGTTTDYSFGNDASRLGQYAWYQKNTWGADEKYAHRVGRKLPNPWGLYDIHGNVWEWCQTWYSDYPNGVLIDPTGPSSGSSRVSRGGCWNYDSSICRSAFRLKFTPDDRGSYLGFRVLRSFVQ